MRAVKGVLSGLAVAAAVTACGPGGQLMTGTGAASTAPGVSTGSRDHRP